MKKRNNKNTAILIFAILIISITTGYALLEENVQIIGKANIKTEGDNEGKYIVTYTIENKWFNGGLYYYNIRMNILNNTNETLDGWKVSISAPQNSKLEGYYDVNAAIQNNNIIFENVDYNSQILPNQNIHFSFIISTTDENYKPGNIIINGSEPINPEKPEGPEESEEEKKAQIEINRTSGWQGEEEYIYQYTIKITNIGNIPINSWRFDIDIKDDSNIEQVWNANYSQVGTVVTFENSDYNAIIPVNDSISFGIMIKTKQENKELEATNIILK